MSAQVRWRQITAAATLVGMTVSVACRRGATKNEPLPHSTVNAAGARSRCEVDIADWALQGCRAPNEPGCEICYDHNPNGTCTIRSGHALSGEFWVYTSASSETDCPATGPRCARCPTDSEAALCEELERRECDCRRDPGIDPCFAPNRVGHAESSGACRRACYLAVLACFRVQTLQQPRARRELLRTYARSYRKDVYPPGTESSGYLRAGEEPH